jgi:hypothetical protein
MAGTLRPPEPGAGGRVLVWDLPLRLFHWSLVLLFLAAWWTGSPESLFALHEACGIAQDLWSGDVGGTEFASGRPSATRREVPGMCARSSHHRMARCPRFAEMAAPTARSGKMPAPGVGGSPRSADRPRTNQESGSSKITLNCCLLQTTSHMTVRSSKAASRASQGGTSAPGIGTEGGGLQSAWITVTRNSVPIAGGSVSPSR